MVSQRGLDVSAREDKYNNEPVNEELTIYVELKEKDYTKEINEIIVKFEDIKKIITE